MRTSTKPISIKEFSTLTQGASVAIDSVFVQVRITLIGETLFTVCGQDLGSGRIARVSPDYAGFEEAWNEKTRIETLIKEAQRECLQRK